MTERELVWSDEAWRDYQRWKDADEKVYLRIRALIENVLATPFEGIGKPEPLRHDLSGYWSRRITREHRLVYTVRKDEIWISSCRYHY